MSSASVGVPGRHHGRLQLELSYDTVTHILNCHVSSAVDLGAGIVNASSSFSSSSAAPKLDPYILVEMRHLSEPSFGRERSSTHVGTNSPTLNWDVQLDLLALKLTRSNDWRLVVEAWAETVVQPHTFLGRMSFSMSDLREAAGGLHWFYFLSADEGAANNVPTVQVLKPPRQTSRPSSQISFWKDEVDRDLYESLSKADRYRQESINELLRTERSYVADLDLVLRTYRLERFEEVLTAEEHRRIVGSLDELRRAGDAFVSRLSALQSKNGYVVDCGDVLGEYLPGLEPLYTQYCGLNEEVTAMLNDKLQTRPRFKALWAECSAECSNMDLHSFRLKPLQRITKYPLLYAEIDTHTGEGHPDKGAIRRAVVDCNALVSRVNEHVRAAELEVQWTEICARLVFPAHLQDVRPSPDNAVLRRTDVFTAVKTARYKKHAAAAATKASKSSDPHRRVLVLEDTATRLPFVLVTQVQADRSQQELLLYPRLPLENVTVRRAVDLPDANADTDVILFVPTASYRFETRDQHVLVLRSGSPQDCKAFYQAMSTRQKQLAEGEISPATIDEVVADIDELRSTIAPLSTDQAKLLRAARLVQGLAARLATTEQEHRRALARKDKQTETLLDIVQSQVQDRMDAALAAQKEKHQAEMQDLKRQLLESASPLRSPTAVRHARSSPRPATLHAPRPHVPSRTSSSRRRSARRTHSAPPIEAGAMMSPPLPERRRRTAPGLAPEEVQLRARQAEVVYHRTYGAGNGGPHYGSADLDVHSTSSGSPYDPGYDSYAAYQLAPDPDPPLRRDHSRRSSRRHYD